MHISIFKKDISFKDNYFKIFDYKGRIVKLSIFFVIVIMLKSILLPAEFGYLESARNKIITGTDNLFDYFVPLGAVFIISCTFYHDYKGSIYKLISFYNSKKYNYIILYRFMIPVCIISLGTFLSGLLYYRNVSFLDLGNIMLSLRFIPNIFFICSLFMCLIVVTKNIYSGIYTTLTYYLIDFLSSGEMFKLISIGANVNNFYYRNSPMYYIANRLLIICMSVLFLYISIKKGNRI